MRTWAKILTGCLLALLLLCVAGGVVFFNSKPGKDVKSIVGNIGRLKNQTRSLGALDKRYPFTPPDDGRLDEEELERYTAVCADLKPKVSAWARWIEAHQNEQGSLQDAGEALGMFGDLVTILSASLETNRMGPAEFTWTHKAVGEALAALAASPTATEAELLAALRKMAALPCLSERERSATKRRVAELEEDISSSKTAASPNAALVAKHRTPLEASQFTAEEWSLVRDLLSRRHRRKGFHTTVEREDSPPSKN